MSGKVSPDEFAILQSQVDDIGRAPAAINVLPADPAKPTIVRDQAALDSLASQVASASEVVIDLETSSLDPRLGVIVGIGLAVGNSTYYVPVNHLFPGNSLLRPGQLSLAEALGALHIVDKPLVGHNAKFEWKWLKYHSGIEARFVWDTMIAARLLRSDLPADLKELARRELDVPDWDMPAADKERIEFLPIESVAEYCAKDCWYTWLVYQQQTGALQERAGSCGLNRFLMHDVEMPLVAVVAAMEEVGYPVDASYFHALRARLDPERAEVLGTIRTLAQDENFNPNSTSQLKTLLFQKLELTPLKTTASGAPSTDAEVLKGLASSHPIIGELIRFRELNKIVSTYCEIPAKLSTDGRFRVEFNQLEAETGRFSSPSVIQTLPRSDKYRIRDGFRAAEGYRIVKADYKQQELRVLAQVSRDENLHHAIHNGIDLHGLAAVEVYHLACAPNEVETQFPEKRDAIKAIQFGLIYGRSAYSLAEALSITKEAAEQLIADYFARFPAVKQFIEQAHAQVTRDGYIDDLFGRRRYLPDAALPARRKQYQRMTDSEKAIVAKIAAAKRAAQNFVIQGASATITKLAMLRCHAHIVSKYGDKARMVLTLHDELQFEVLDCLVPEFVAELPELMCDLGLELFGFTIPMAVDIKVGPSWGQAKKWEGGQDGSGSQDA